MPGKAVLDTNVWVSYFINARADYLIQWILALVGLPQLLPNYSGKILLIINQVNALLTWRIIFHGNYEYINGILAGFPYT